MRTYGAAVLLAGLATLSAAAPGPAASVQQMLATVQSRAEEGQFLEALEELKAVEYSLWKSMPSMALRKAVLVTEEPAFFSSYSPRPDNRYRPGEAVLLYVEPVGYSIVEEGDRYRFSLTADFTLVDSKGQILGGQREFGRWEMSSLRPVTDFMMYFTFDFSGLKAGPYNIETVVRDLNSGKTLEFITPFVVAE